MAGRRIIRWLSFGLLAVFVILLGVFLALLTSPVQTYIVQKVLKSYNENLTGSLSIERFHAGLSGNVRVTKTVLRVEQDRVVASLDTLTVRLDLPNLLDGDLILYDVSLQGLRLDLAIDSTGSNLQCALAPKVPSPPDTAEKESKPLYVRLDRLTVRDGQTSVLWHDTLKVELTDWQCSARGVLDDVLLKGKVNFSAPEQMDLDLESSLRLDDFLQDLFVHCNLLIDSAFTAILPSPLPVCGSLSVQADCRTRSDTLAVQCDLTSGSLGTVRMKGEAGLPIDPLGCRGEMEFDRLRPAPLWQGNSEDVLIHGTARFEKQLAEEITDGWQLSVDLSDSRYGDYTLRTARLTGSLIDSAASLRGFVDTGHGAAELNITSEGLDPERLTAQAELDFRRIDLHHFLPAVPDTLSALTGRLSARMQRPAADNRSVRAAVRLEPLSLGNYCLDSLIVHAAVDSTYLSLDTLTAAVGSARLHARASGYLGGDLTWSAAAEVPRLSESAEAIKPLVDSLEAVEGELSLTLSGSASLAGDSLSALKARGDLRLHEVRYGDYAVELAAVKLLRFDLDDLSCRAAVYARNMTAAEQKLDSLSAIIDGNLQSFHTNLQLWGREDTLQLRTAFTTEIFEGSTEITFERLSAEAFDTEWKTEDDFTLSLSENTIDITGLTLRSALGVLRINGFLQQEGEQDLVVEASGFQTVDLGRLFKMEIPSAAVNARVQLYGTSDALQGEVTITADSVRLPDMDLADEITLHARLGGQTASFDGYSIWFGDTLALLEGELPARLSLDEGFILYDSLEMNARMRLYAQPLERINTFLPFGIKLSGFATGHLSFTGTPAEPDWNGAFSIRNAAYTDSRFGIHYKYIQISALVDHDTLKIVTCRLTSGGTLTGSGWVLLEFPLPGAMRLDLNLDKFIIMDSPLQQARASGHLTAEGPLMKLDAEGKLTFSDILYRITQTTSKEVEPVNLEAELARLRGDTVVTEETFVDAIYAGMSHRLKVDIPGNCWIRGGGVNLELFGNLDIDKESEEEPQMIGQISVRRGTVRFYSRELRVTEGVIRFDGPYDDPTLDIWATDPRLTARDNINVKVHIHGRAEEPILEFSGTDENGSEMTETEVVTLLTFGRKLSEVTAEETAAEVATQQLSGMVGRWSGLDVFEFRPGEGGLNDLSSGSLEVGTYITDRLFIRVLQPVETSQGGQEVTIEYQLIDWLKLSAQQTGSDNSSFEMFLQFDWR